VTLLRTQPEKTPVHPAFPFKAIILNLPSAVTRISHAAAVGRCTDDPFVPPQGHRADTPPTGKVPRRPASILPTLFPIQTYPEMTGTECFPAALLFRQRLLQVGYQRGTEQCRVKTVAWRWSRGTVNGWNALLLRRIIQLHIGSFRKTIVRRVKRSPDTDRFMPDRRTLRLGMFATDHGNARPSNGGGHVR
jgi:hypothetical protein